MPDQRVDDTTTAIRAYVLLTFMALFFSSNILIGRAAADLVSPFTLAFFRWTIAFLILLPIGWAGIVAHRATLRSQASHLAAMGFLGMWICGAIVYIGLKSTTATNAALIYTASPVLIILFEWLRGSQAMSAARLAGVVTALVGVLAIVFKGDIGAVRTLSFNRGDLWIGLAAVSWSVYSIISRRDAIRILPTMSLMAVVTGLGALMLAPVAAWEALQHGLPTAPQAWASIFGVALIASVLAFTSYQKGVKMVGPSTTSLFLYLNPVYAAVIASLFLGEAIHVYHLAGAALIFAGVTAATGTWAPPVGRTRSREA